MGSSILSDVKKLCNIHKSETGFDIAIILHTNSAIARLWQLGTFSGTLKSIQGEEEAWEDLENRDNVLPLVKEYVGLKVRAIFDPPQSNALEQALTSRIDELEFAINVEADLTETEREELLKSASKKLKFEDDKPDF